jgi:hypothetical protein
MPPTEVYEIYPQPHVPPYHYRNAVTGKAPTYPGVDRGGPTPQLAAAALMPMSEVSASKQSGDLTRAIAQAETDVARFKDYHSIENLESAYGYYLDKSMWDGLADLFAVNGTMELAQRGVYKGAASVRNMLWLVFGRGGAGPTGSRPGSASACCSRWPQDRALHMAHRSMKTKPSRKTACGNSAWCTP